MRGRPPSPPPERSRAVTQALARDILSGQIPPGARLASERELAERFATSRVTVREALRALVAWDVVSIRRGSGITVRPRNEWRLDVLPAYVAHVSADASPAAAEVVRDVLDTRRDLVLSLLARAAARSPRPGALDPARAAVEAAWARRSDPVDFAHLELAIYRAWLEACGLLASAWLVNSLSEVYVTASHLLPAFGLSGVPDEFVAAHLEMIRCLEAGDGAGARIALGGYLERRDASLFEVLDAVDARRPPPS